MAQTLLGSCKELLDYHLGKGTHPPSGIYKVRPAGVVGAFDAYCDMVDDGGGWTLYASGTPSIRSLAMNPPRLFPATSSHARPGGAMMMGHDFYSAPPAGPPESFATGSSVASRGRRRARCPRRRRLVA